MGFPPCSLGKVCPAPACPNTPCRVASHTDHVAMGPQLLPNRSHTPVLSQAHQHTGSHCWKPSSPPTIVVTIFIVLFRLHLVHTCVFISPPRLDPMLSIRSLTHTVCICTKQLISLLLHAPPQIPHCAGSVF